MDSAVILSSGGINGAVAAAVAREQYELALLHVTWGHRAAERELIAFEQLAAATKPKQTSIVELSSLAAFGGNARISRRIPIEQASTLGGDTPNTFMLGLTPTLLSLGTAWAGSIGAKRIFIGTSENHGVSGPAIGQLYPDHRSVFLAAFNLMLQHAKPTKRELIVTAPLLDLTKTEVIQLGRQLKVPFEHTWSCYAGNERPCDHCLSCTTRAAAFLQTGQPDPLPTEPVNA